MTRKFRPDLVAAFILLILPLLLFWQVTIGPYTLLPVDNLFAFEPWASYRDEYGVGLPQNQLLSDLILENYVWKTFIRDSMAAGQVPLWDPYIFAGHPFLANGQHSALYPFSILFYILPLPKAYGWFTVSQLWLAGLNMYIFARVLRQSRIGALLAGITFSLSAFFLVRVVFTMVLAGAVWLPLLLAVIEIVIRKQEEKGPTPYSPIPYIAAGAVILGIQTLAGHVEITYYTLLVGGFYAFCRLSMLWWQQRVMRTLLPLSIWLLVMIALGLGLGTAQLGPMYEIVTQNFRDSSVTLEQVRGWALPLRRVISFAIPDFFGSPAHHGYFDLLTLQWQPLGLNANGEINPLCPNCTSWDTKTAVEAGSYVGLLPLLFALLAVYYSIRVPKFQHRSTIAIFSLLAILSLLFMFGSPLYAILFYGLPGWNQLHSPFRWIFPYTISLAVMAGIGVTHLESHLKNRLSPYTGPLQPLSLALIGSGSIGIISLLVVLVGPEPFIQLSNQLFARSGLAQNAFADGRQFLGYQWPNLLKFSLAILGAGIVLRSAIRRWSIPRLNRLGLPLWQLLAIVVVAADLLVAGWGFNPAVDPNLLNVKPRLIDWLQEKQVDDPYYRITSFDTPEGEGNKLLLANASSPYGIYDVRGYDSIIPGQYAQFMQLIQPNGDLLFNRIGPIYYDGYSALDSALLDLLGVRYVLSKVDIGNPNYELVYDDELRVYENTDALPRAFAVPKAVDISSFETDGRSPEEAYSFGLRSLNPREQVILDGEANGLGRDLIDEDATSTVAETTVTITDYTPNEIFISAAMADDGWLVLADTYFPGWRAYATPKGGENSEEPEEIEVTIHRANGNFRAVQLPAGEWDVRFRYSPRSVQLGLYASFLAFVSIIFLLGYWLWSRLYREHDTDSAIKRVAKNSLVPMVLAVSNRLVDFAFALLMLRILQPEGAGRFAFAVAFIGLTEIITRYGLGTLVTRDVAANRDESNRYLSNVTILRVYFWLAALPIVAAILGVYFIYGDLTMDVVITIALLGLGTLLSNLSDGLTAIFYAHEKAEYPAAISTVTNLSRISFGALALLLGWGITGLAGASLLGNLVAFLVLSYILVTKIFRPKFEADGTLQRTMIGESLPLMINHLLSTIFFRIDVFILQPTWGDSAVGFYNAAYKYVDGINIIPQYFTLAIFPLMSRFASDSRESLIRAYLLSLRLLLMLAIPIAMGTPFIARELILFLAGERFVPDSMIVLQLLIWFLPFSFINQVTQYVLIAINQQRFLTRAFIIGVLFNLITNLIFVPFYGYRAAAITTILSEWALLIPFYILVRRNLCTVPWFDVAWRPTVAAVAMGATLWFAGDLNFIITVIVATTVYGVTLIATGGLHQQDMDVIWRALPLDRVRQRLGWQSS